jgi:hypothetical protein
MLDFKSEVLNGKRPVLLSAGGRMPDPREAGVILMTRTLPMMDEKGFVVFAYGQTKETPITLTSEQWEKGKAGGLAKMRCDEGDTEWFYDFVRKDGTKRRVVMRSVIYYDPDVPMPLSPYAVLFRQYLASGCYFVRCRFENA